MVHPQQEKLRWRLEQLPYEPVPSPWTLPGNHSVGGLTEVGYAEESDDLLAVSSSGRGLYDCITGNRSARDRNVTWEPADHAGLNATGIGKHANSVVRVAGLRGGGLATRTQDGWGLYVVPLPWPIHVVFLTSNGAHVADPSGQVTKLCNDEPCEFRAAGFSPTGRSFVVATSGEIMIYGRSG
jgi:hypothetical protein